VNDDGQSGFCVEFDVFMAWKIKTVSWDLMRQSDSHCFGSCVLEDDSMSSPCWHCHLQVGKVGER
jgi:hypothetical protein